VNRAERAAWRKVRRQMGSAFTNGLAVERQLFGLLGPNPMNPERSIGDAIQTAMASYDELLAAMLAFDELLPGTGSQTAAATAKRHLEAQRLEMRAREMRERGDSITKVAQALKVSPRHISRVTRRRNVSDEPT
jgi:hypothetical protein